MIFSIRPGLTANPRRTYTRDTAAGPTALRQQRQLQAHLCYTHTTRVPYTVLCRHMTGGRGRVLRLHSV